MIADLQQSSDYVISVSEHESLQLKRLGDNVVQVSLDDELTGTLTKCAYYKCGTWKAYNAPNFDKLLKMFRTHIHLCPKLYKYLGSIPTEQPDMDTLTRVVSDSRRRLIIKVKSIHRTVSNKLTI